MDRIVPESVFEYIEQQAQQDELSPLYGDCAEIALALDEVFGTRHGGQLQGVYERENPVPIHCALALSDGTLIDGTGPRTEQELIDEYDDRGTTLDVRPVARSEVERICAADWSLYDRLIEKFEALRSRQKTIRTDKKQT